VANNLSQERSARNQIAESRHESLKKIPRSFGGEVEKSRLSVPEEVEGEYFELRSERVTSALQQKGDGDGTAVQRAGGQLLW